MSAGISQRQLALIVGISQPTIARLESGRRAPSQRTVRLLSELLDFAPELEAALLEQASPKRRQRQQKRLVRQARWAVVRQERRLERRFHRWAFVKLALPKVVLRWSQLVSTHTPLSG